MIEAVGRFLKYLVFSRGKMPDFKAQKKGGDFSPPLISSAYSAIQSGGYRFVHLDFGEISSR
jgi:hypothetical protein